MGSEMCIRDRDEADTIHDIGCKTIIRGASLVNNLLKSEIPFGMPQRKSGKLCRRSDFNESSLRLLHSNFTSGMIPDYLSSKKSRDSNYPIITLS